MKKKNASRIFFGGRGVLARDLWKLWTNFRSKWGAKEALASTKL